MCCFINVFDEALECTDKGAQLGTAVAPTCLSCSSHTSVLKALPPEANVQEKFNYIGHKIQFGNVLRNFKQIKVKVLSFGKERTGRSRYSFPIMSLVWS